MPHDDPPPPPPECQRLPQRKQLCKSLLTSLTIAGVGAGWIVLGVALLVPVCVETPERFVCVQANASWCLCETTNNTEVWASTAPRQVAGANVLFGIGALALAIGAWCMCAIGDEMRERW
jgi:hypothetical protein